MNEQTPPPPASPHQTKAKHKLKTKQLNKNLGALPLEPLHSPKQKFRMEMF
jgi:hypothetical protein